MPIIVDEAPLAMISNRVLTVRLRCLFLCVTPKPLLSQWKISLV